MHPPLPKATCAATHSRIGGGGTQKKKEGTSGTWENSQRLFMIFIVRLSLRVWHHDTPAASSVRADVQNKGMGGGVCEMTTGVKKVPLNDYPEFE